MSDALYIAATGMQAQQVQVDAISNNIANLNTNGFKKSRVSFEPLMPQVMQQAGAAAQSFEQQAPSYKGMGAAVASLAADFTPGELKQTQRELDVAINGAGFFEVQLPDGTVAYTREGALRIDQQGTLALSSGLPLSAQISIPTDAESVVINADGRVQIKHPGSDELSDAGYLELARFVNERGLKPMSDGVYLATEESGDALIGRPGENGVGALAQGYVESSNVQMVEELTSLMVAQRAYEASSKVLAAADEMQSIVNNLRRG
jgi:flagellar basal-body rod protein FlgG